MTPGLVVAAHTFPPRIGGVERMAARLAEHVAPGRTLVVAAPHPGADAHDRDRPYAVERRPLIGRVPPRWAPTRRALAGYGGVPLLCTEWWPELRAAAATKRRATTGVVVYGADLLRATTTRTRRLLARTLERADVLIAISDYTASLLDGTGVQVTAVVPPGVDLDTAAADPEALRAELGLGDGPVVLAVGRLVERKGHADLASRWATVRTAVPGATLVIVGDGPERANLEGLAGDGTATGIRLVGVLDDERVAGLFRLAQVHVLPGRPPTTEVEGFGIVAVEAGVAGTPTVATAVGGTPEAVGPGGVLVPAGDPSAIVDAVIDLLRDEPARAELGRRARAHAEGLAWPVVGARYAELLGLPR